MKVKTYKLTAQKIEELKSNLKQLDEVSAPKITEQLAELRSTTQEEFDTTLADLLEAKAALVKKRKTIEYMLSNYELAEEQNENGIVDIGNTVKLKFGEFKVEYQVVTSEEADPLESKISNESAVGKALLGRAVGDTVEVDNGIVTLEYKILDIS